MAGAKISLKNAAPGVFFALFGCIIITVVVYRGASFSFPDDNVRGVSISDNPNQGKLQYECAALPLAPSGPFSNEKKLQLMCSAPTAHK